MPAHDEADGIGATLDTLRDQVYPDDHYQVVVVADNCSDETAAVASAAGCTVLTRDVPDARGKGHALRWAMDRLVRSHPDADAFVVVDADTVADPGLLSALADAFSRGAEVAQADYEAWVDGTGAGAQLRAAAFLLFHRVRFSGRARLHVPCALVGNGMLLSRSTVTAVPWSAFSEAEDLEYTIQLRLAGVRPAFVGAARLRAPVASGGAAAGVQRRRWEGGRLRLARQYLPRVVDEVVRRRRIDLWDVAVDLATPPLGVLCLGSAVGAAASAGLTAGGVVRPTAVVPWAAAASMLAVHVLVGLRAAHAPRETYWALTRAPALVLRQTRERARVLHRARQQPEWERTPRSQPSAWPVAATG